MSKKNEPPPENESDNSDNEELEDEELEDEEEDEEYEEDNDNDDVEEENNEEQSDSDNSESEYEEEEEEEEKEEEEDEENDNEENDDIGIILPEMFSETKLIERNERITKPIMTKFEFVKILGIRTNILSRGAKPMFKNTANLTSREIAIMELKNKSIPLYISRPMPNSNPEIWHIDELYIPEKFFKK